MAIVREKGVSYRPVLTPAAQRRGCFTSHVNTHDLAMLVPELMAPHPGHTWSLLSGGGHGVDLDFEVRPVAAPSRVATVVVLASAEVYHVSFEGHTDTDFAYDDADRPDALRGRIELAAAATTGPTRVTLKLAGETVIRSEVVLDPDGPGPLEAGPVYYPLQRLKAFLCHRRVVEKVLDYPAITSS